MRAPTTNAQSTWRRRLPNLPSTVSCLAAVATVLPPIARGTRGSGPGQEGMRQATRDGDQALLMCDLPHFDATTLSGQPDSNQLPAPGSDGLVLEQA